MPEPIALCIERLEGAGEVFTGCVAVVGREPGLSLGEDGEAAWMQAGPASRLCVAQDGRLVLLRDEESVPVTLLRGGRSLEVPPERPVFVLDQDVLALARGARVRLHVHGPAAPRAPWPVRIEGARPGASRWLLIGAAALALGSAAGFGQAKGSGSQPTAQSDAGPTSGPATRPIEVRERPPVIPPEPRPPGCGGCSK
jgi:hypothetical protein